MFEDCAVSLYLWRVKITKCSMDEVSSLLQKANWREWQHIQREQLGRVTSAFFSTSRRFAFSEYLCTVFSLYREYVERFFLPDCVFLPCDHDLYENSINQSIINQSIMAIDGRNLSRHDSSMYFCYLNLPISKCQKSSPLSQGKNTPSVKGKAYTTSSTYKEETAMVQNTRKKLDVQRD